MSQCSICTKKPTKQRTIDPISKICIECIKKIHDINSSNQLNGMNEYLANANHVQQDNSTQQTNVIPTDTNNNTVVTITADDEYWKQFDQRLNTRLNTVEVKLTEIIKQQNHKITLLEKKCEGYEENIDNLKSIVSRQQRSLANLDREEREKNLIFTGVNENPIMCNNNTYSTDEEKVDFILGLMDIIIPSDYEVTRLGKQNSNYHRPIKVNVRTKTNRDDVLKVAKKLKNSAAPWVNIYVKADQHPVIIQENNRLRTKLKKLKNLDENKEKNVRLEKGKLKIDNTIVDQNLFFA